MTRIEDVPMEDLRGATESFDQHRSIRRLYAAILYKQGVSAPRIADWFDVRPATVYGWLDRLEPAESIIEGVTDDTRPGRPTKLNEEELEDFFGLLSKPPTAVGMDAKKWTPRIARGLLASRYGVDYSVRHLRRLLKRAEVE